ncbi:MULTISPECIES: DUF983 domain-containing protein [Pseudovibrio]|uniref:DUF983 domain-containing protein n=1 Tax=Stappiaceae TaxID=2821832 RepID=UPI0023671B67|nr:MULTISPECIES: DUF983 domain-containing protein [Pseudovibrio]MDD7910695.1 DUF983 domain-containing protein [Pseudovibrio exalbescens]MDX5594466.1 DUF983 domain-containing protein [Pseudovibrio sp. SPO723]
MSLQESISPPPKRDVASAMAKGGLLKCPSCGNGKMFESFLKVKQSCDACGEELHHHRADDAPPYFTIFIVGHIVVALCLAVEMAFFPPLWLHMALWLPLTVVMSLAMLPPIKGSLVGLQWALRMHGFDLKSEDEEETGDNTFHSVSQA